MERNCNVNYVTAIVFYKVLQGFRSDLTFNSGSTLWFSAITWNFGMAFFFYSVYYIIMSLLVGIGVSHTMPQDVRQCFRIAVTAPAHSCLICFRVFSGIEGNQVQSGAVYKTPICEASRATSQHEVRAFTHSIALP